MHYRRLGKSDLKVSVVGFGCWPIVGGFNWGEQAEKDSLAALRKAYELGVNFFDTAEVYGDGYSEKLLGKALKKRRKNNIIATKVLPQNLAPKDLKSACEDSLRRLQTDYIDIYYIHWPSRKVPISETLSAMNELKKEGKIRVCACSNFGAKDLKELLQYSRVEVNQLPYSLLWRAIEYEIQEICIQNDISITCYSPLLLGLLTGKFSSADEVPDGRARTRHFSKTRPQTVHNEPGAEKETFRCIDKIRKLCHKADLSMIDAALSWIINRPGVTSVIVGARTPEQIKANIRAIETDLPNEIIEKLDTITEPLKERFGDNPDMWQSKSRYR